MTDIHGKWTYGKKYIHSSTGYNMYLVYVIYDADGMYICETRKENTAKLICKLPEFYDTVKEFTDPDLNPDFDYLQVKRFIELIDYLCEYGSNQEA